MESGTFQSIAASPETLERFPCSRGDFQPPETGSPLSLHPVLSTIKGFDILPAIRLPFFTLSILHSSCSCFPWLLSVCTLRFLHECRHYRRFFPSPLLLFATERIETLQILLSREIPREFEEIKREEVLRVPHYRGLSSPKGAE